MTTNAAQTAHVSLWSRLPNFLLHATTSILEYGLQSYGANCVPPKDNRSDSSGLPRLRQYIEITDAEKKAIWFALDASSMDRAKLLAQVSLSARYVATLRTTNRVSIESLEKLVKLVTLASNHLKRPKDSPHATKIVRALTHKAEKARETADMSFLDQLIDPETSANGSSVAGGLANFGFVPNPTLDKDKRGRAEKIRKELIAFAEEIRKDNSDEAANVRDTLLAFLKAILLLLGDNANNPADALPQSLPQGAKTLTDRLEKIEKASASGRKTYENGSAIIGGLMKLLNLV